MILTPRSLAVRFCSTTRKSSSSLAAALVDNPTPVQPRPRDVRDVTITNLGLPLTGIGESTYAPTKPKGSRYYETYLTKLENGLRVVSQPRFGKYATVGIAIATGARYEKAFRSGTAHFIEKLGFMVSHKSVTMESVVCYINYSTLS